jgi:hypothetical protein
LLHPGGPKLLLVLLRGLLFSTRPLPFLGSPLGILSSAPEKSSHTSFVAHYPGVVAWGNGPGVPRTELVLGTVVHPHTYTPREHVAHVRNLATLSASNGLDVLRPPPSRLEHGPTYAACPASFSNDGGLCTRTR